MSRSAPGRIKPVGTARTGLLSRLMVSALGYANSSGEHMGSAAICLRGKRHDARRKPADRRTARGLVRMAVSMDASARGRPGRPILSRISVGVEAVADSGRAPRTGANRSRKEGSRAGGCLCQWLGRLETSCCDPSAHEKPNVWRNGFPFPAACGTRPRAIPSR